MGTFEKLLERMRRNPRGDWTMDNLLAIARRMNIEVRNSDGSHVTVPYKRPIKPVYIKKILALVDAVKEFV